MQCLDNVVAEDKSDQITELFSYSNWLVKLNLIFLNLVLNIRFALDRLA